MSKTWQELNTEVWRLRAENNRLRDGLRRLRDFVADMDPHDPHVIRVDELLETVGET